MNKIRRELLGKLGDELAKLKDSIADISAKFDAVKTGIDALDNLDLDAAIASLESAAE